jgi:hypothetical protein
VLVLAKLLFWIPENGALVLKRVGIFCVMYDFDVFYVHSLLTALTCKKDAVSM